MEFRIIENFMKVEVIKKQKKDKFIKYKSVIEKKTNRCSIESYVLMLKCIPLLNFFSFSLGYSIYLDIGGNFY